MGALEILIVVLLVAGSVVFSAWRLSPAKLRLRFLDRVAPRSASRWMVRLRHAALAELTRGCHACARALAGAHRAGVGAAPHRRSAS